MSNWIVFLLLTSYRRVVVQPYICFLSTPSLVCVWAPSQPGGTLAWWHSCHHWNSSTEGTSSFHLLHHFTYFITSLTSSLHLLLHFTDFITSLTSSLHLLHHFTYFITSLTSSLNLLSLFLTVTIVWRRTWTGLVWSSMMLIRGAESVDVASCSFNADS